MSLNSDVLTYWSLNEARRQLTESRSRLVDRIEDAKLQDDLPKALEGTRLLMILDGKLRDIRDFLKKGGLPS